jgi:hypothetical protein
MMVELFQFRQTTTIPQSPDISDGTFGELADGRGIDLVERIGESLDALPPLSLRHRCGHNGTDGTIDCPQCGLSAGDFIRAAHTFLIENDGAEIVDPGYLN